MGTGASTKRKGQPASKQCIDSLSLERRRRLLLGRVELGAFEKVRPREQFHEAPPEDDDPVFMRWRDNGDWDEVDAFRKHADDVQNPPGWLGKNSLELLDPFQPPGSPLPSLLAPLLLKVAQVQRLGEDVQRCKDHLTCYELLALHSALRWAASEVLLELLYCVFDSDGDDHLSVEDLSTGISAFLELQEASGALVGTDLDGAFNPQDIKARNREAHRLAVMAIKDFGGVPPPTPVKPTAVLEEPVEEQEQDEEASNDPSENDAAGGAGGGSSSEASSSEESGQSNLSTKPLREGKSETKRKNSRDKRATDAKVPPPVARKNRGFRCCGAAPRDESADEGTTAKTASDIKKSKAAATKGAAKKKAAVVHQPAQGKKGGCLTGACGNKQRVLTFPQWQDWLSQTGLLPEGLLPPPAAPDTLALQAVPAATGAGVGDSSDSEEDEDDGQFTATQAAPQYRQRRPLC